MLRLPELPSLDIPDRLTFGGIALQAIGFTLLPFTGSAWGLIVPGLWLTAFGILIGRRGS
jgi:hypothetical protein